MAKQIKEKYKHKEDSRDSELWFITRYARESKH